MRDTHLLQLALGIQSPWFVATSDFDPDNKRLDIALDFKSGSRFDCPECKAAGCPCTTPSRRRGGTWISFSTRRF